MNIPVPWEVCSETNFLFLYIYVSYGQDFRALNFVSISFVMSAVV
jgi:hypothetical protein